MSSKIKTAGSRSKTRASGVVRENVGLVRPISPVMQKLRDLLPEKKPHVHMHLATDLSLSYCEKLLDGRRKQTDEVLVALLRSKLGREVLFTVMDGADADWFVRYRKQLDIDAARKSVEETVRKLDALQAEIGQ